MKTAVKITILVALGMFSLQSFAQEKSQEPQKVDVKNLEKKYWAPKDKKFKVVQNRTYTKTKKLSLSIMPGLMLNEEYSKGYALTGSLGYYFTDRYGAELEYQYISLDDNALQSEVIKLGGFGDHGKAESYIGAAFRWMPFYAKMSWLGTKIVYFDLSIGATLGLTQYTEQYSPALVPQLEEKKQTALTFGFDISQSFYLSKKFVLRVDYKHRFHNQEVKAGAAHPSTGLQPGDKVQDRLEDNISLNVGLTYLF